MTGPRKLNPLFSAVFIFALLIPTAGLVFATISILAVAIESDRMALIAMPQVSIGFSVVGVIAMGGGQLSTRPRWFFLLGGTLLLTSVVLLLAVFLSRFVYF